MNRIAVIGIIVEEPQEVEKLNQLLHEYGSYIIRRISQTIVLSCAEFKTFAAKLRGASEIIL